MSCSLYDHNGRAHAKCARCEQIGAAYFGLAHLSTGAVVGVVTGTLVAGNKPRLTVPIQTSHSEGVTWHIATTYRRRIRPICSCGEFGSTASVVGARQARSWSPNDNALVSAGDGWIDGVPTTPGAYFVASKFVPLTIPPPLMIVHVMPTGLCRWQNGPPVSAPDTWLYRSDMLIDLP